MYFFQNITKFSKLPKSSKLKTIFDNKIDSVKKFKIEKVDYTGDSFLDLMIIDSNKNENFFLINPNVIFFKINSLKFIKKNPKNGIKGKKINMLNLKWETSKIKFLHNNNSQGKNITDCLKYTRIKRQNFLCTTSTKLLFLYRSPKFEKEKIVNFSLFFEINNF